MEGDFVVLTHSKVVLKCGRGGEFEFVSGIRNGAALNCDESSAIGLILLIHTGRWDYLLKSFRKETSYVPNAREGNNLFRVRVSLPHKKFVKK